MGGMKWTRWMGQRGEDNLQMSRGLTLKPGMTLGSVGFLLTSQTATVAAWALSMVSWLTNRGGSSAGGAGAGARGVWLGALQAGAKAAVAVAVVVAAAIAVIVAVVVAAADVKGAAAAAAVVVATVAAAAAGADNVSAAVAEADAQVAVAARAGMGGGLEGMSENSRRALWRGDLCPGVDAWKEGVQQGVSNK